MKNNTLIKLLFISYIVVGALGIIHYPAPDNQNNFSASSDFRHFSEETLSARKKPAQRADEAHAQSGSFYESVRVPTPDDDVFVLDEWLNQIDDFLSRVDERENDSRDAESSQTDGPLIIENTAPVKKSVIPVIIDTDFASDADDVVAIRLAMCFQDAGLIDIRGIALSTTYSRSPLALHALCRQDGYGNIPVAMDTSGSGIQVHTDYVDAMYAMPKSREDYSQPVQM